MSLPKPAHGRRLSDLWLDGELGKLHPAEWKLLDCAAKGQWCVLGDRRPTYATADNRIRAEVLRFVLLGGDAQHPVHEKGVRLRHAFVECGKQGLNLESVQISQPIRIETCTIAGRIRLIDASSKSVDLRGSHVEALLASRLNLRGQLVLQHGFTCRERVTLIGAEVTEQVSFSGAELAGQPVALSADRLVVHGTLFLNDGFRSAGEVLLRGCSINGQMSCRNGRFLGNGTSIRLQNAMIGSSLLADKGFRAAGKVDLSGASIAGQFICNNAIFSDKAAAIHAPRAKIGGNVDLGEECRAAGPISFQGATIGGDMIFSGGSFEGKPAVNLRNASIDGMLVWRGVRHAWGELNLAGASCRTLNMDWDAWSKPVQIRLDQFSYKGFSELPTGCDADFWKAWLERQPENHRTSKFRPNPYARLADVLDAMGHEQEAVSVRVAQKQRHLAFVRHHEPVAERGRLMRRLAIFWIWLTGALVDYGYRPGKALLYLIALIVMGAVIYQLAAYNGIMTPTHPLIFKEAGATIPKACSQNWIYPPPEIQTACETAIPSEYSTFSALIYSADIALPIVDLRLESDWSPRLADWQTGAVPGLTHTPPWGWGWWVRAWEWLQIALGWLFSLLFVSAVGGMIRR